MMGAVEELAFPGELNKRQQHASAYRNRFGKNGLCG